MDLSTGGHGESETSRTDAIRDRRQYLGKGGSAGLRGHDMTWLRCPCLNSRKIRPLGIYITSRKGKEKAKKGRGERETGRGERE